MKIQFLRPALLGALFGLPQLASAQVQLISWWNFDTGGTNGLSIDAQAGVPAQILEGAARTAEGEGRTGTGTDRAMNFGNSRHRLYVTDASFLNQAGAANAISISFWQKLAAVRNQTTIFANSTTVARAISGHTPWSDNNIYFDTAGCCDGGTQRISGPPTDPVTWVGQWNHVLLIKNGDTKEVYVNGVLGATGTNTGPLPTDFTDLVIGNAPNLGEAVDGALDDFAIFAGALDAGQIAQLVGGASPASLVGPNDTDADGLPDGFEYRFFPGDLTKLTAAGDFDVDGVTDATELANGTNPKLADSDGDGLADGVETNTGTWVGPGNTGTSPLLADTDGDGLNDGAESNTGTFVSATNAGTNPFLRDTDGDGFTDGSEALFSSANPVNPASRPLRSGLLDIVAYWPFDDNSNPAQALDVVKGFPGELQNTTAYTADGEGRSGLAGDKAIDLGAGTQDNAVRVAAAGFLNIPAAQNEIAISFWQKLDAVVNSSSFWADSPSAGGSRGLNAHATWDNANLYWDTNGCCDGGNRINGPTAVDLVGTWHHLVFQKKGNAKEVWLDGVLAVSGSNTNPLNTDFTVLHIGSDNGAANIAGRIDEFAVFADALDAAQIAALAGGASPLSIVPPNTDSDGDGMPNAYENANGLNPNLDDRLLDLDVDGANNFAEYLGGTAPNNPDSDGDSLKDGVETKTGTYVSASDTGTDPLKADTDADGFGDAVETNTGTFVSAANTGTNPNKADTDSDKWSDSTEINFNSNPFLASSVPTLDPNQPELVAWWPFNDASRPLAALDSVHNINADLLNGAAFTADGLGRSGVAGDRALDLSTSKGGKMARVLGAQWLNLIPPAPESSPNLGSLGAIADLIVGSAAFDAPGALAGSTNTAMTFTGGLNTRVPFSPELNPSAAFTAEAWLKPAVDNAAGVLTCAMSSGHFADPRSGWLIYQSDTGWNFRTYNQAGLAAEVNITGGGVPVVGNWHHVVVTWDGTVGKVYVNGVLGATSDPKPFKAAVDGDVHIGSRSDAGFGWSGDADEVAFYNTALSDAVIADHFANGTNAARPQPYETLVLASNPTGYWRMTDPTPGVPIPPDQIAVSFWLNLAQVTDSSAFWGSSPSSNNGERGIQAHVPWGDNNFYFDTAGCCDGTQRTNGPNDVDLVGTWHHLVFQKNGPDKQVWVDGVLKVSGSNDAPIPNDFYMLTIGSIPDGNNLLGLMDDFAIFDTALTEEQVLRLAAGENPNAIYTPGAALEFTTISYNPALNQVVVSWTSAPGKTYKLQSSETLTSWPVEINDAIPSGGATTSYTHNLTAAYPGGNPAKLFYRVTQN